jgi:Protein phosphatase 2C
VQATAASPAALTQNKNKERAMRAGGWMGMGERGVGGSKCGATAAAAVLYQKKDGATNLLAANVGDSRVLLIRGCEAIQLTTGAPSPAACGHVPAACVHVEGGSSSATVLSRLHLLAAAGSGQAAAAWRVLRPDRSPDRESIVSR